MQVHYSVVGEQAEPKGPTKAYSIRQACETLQISRATIYRLSERNELKIIRIGGRSFIPATEIERIVTQGTDA